MLNRTEAMMATKQCMQIACMDVDPKSGCAFQVRTETEDELWRLSSEHAKIAHKMSSVPPEMTAKLKAAVKTVAVTV
jgi:predicted small metal-binding protein